MDAGGTQLGAGEPSKMVDPNDTVIVELGRLTEQLRLRMDTADQNLSQADVRFGEMTAALERQRQEIEMPQMLSTRQTAP